MPVEQYEVKTYIKDLLTIINITNIPDEDVNIYRELIEYSIGFNPRNLKRSFNCLLLLDIVATKKKLYEEFKNDAEKREQQRAIFALICLQQAYGPLYKYLTKIAEKITNDLMFELKDENTYKSDQDDTIYSKIFAEINTEHQRATATTLANFMKSFFAAIQLKSDNDPVNLSNIEINHLRTVLKFANVTSSSDSQESSSDLSFEIQSRRNTRVAKALVTNFTKDHKQLLKKICQGRKKQFSFTYHKGEPARYVYIEIAAKFKEILGADLRISIDNFHYYIYSDTPEAVNLDWVKELRQKLSQDLPSARQGDLNCTYDEDDSFRFLEGSFPNDCSEEEQISTLTKLGNIFFSNFASLDLLNDK